jgi:hypothetical protein
VMILFVVLGSPSQLFDHEGETADTWQHIVFLSYETQ